MHLPVCGQREGVMRAFHHTCRGQPDSEQETPPTTSSSKRANSATHRPQTQGGALTFNETLLHQDIAVNNIPPFYKKKKTPKTGGRKQVQNKDGKKLLYTEMLCYL